MSFINQTTGLSIKDVLPNMKNINLYFIVLESGPLLKMKNNDELRILKVADKTGSINFSAWNEFSSCINPGDICKLHNGYTVVRKSVIGLSTSKQSELTKVGEFCFLFAEHPDRSVPNPEYAVFDRRSDTDADSGGGDGTEPNGGRFSGSGLGGSQQGGPSSYSGGNGAGLNSAGSADAPGPSSSLSNGSIGHSSCSTDTNNSLRPCLGGSDVDERRKKSVSTPSAVGQGDQDLRWAHQPDNVDLNVKRGKIDNGNFKKSVSSPALHPEDCLDYDLRHKVAVGATDPRLQAWKSSAVGALSWDVDERRLPSKAQQQQPFSSNDHAQQQVLPVHGTFVKAPSEAGNLMGSTGGESTVNTAHSTLSVESRHSSYNLNNGGRSTSHVMSSGTIKAPSPSMASSVGGMNNSNHSLGVPFVTYAPPDRVNVRLHSQTVESPVWDSASPAQLAETNNAHSNRELLSHQPQHPVNRFQTQTNGIARGGDRHQMMNGNGRPFRPQGYHGGPRGGSSDPRLLNKIQNPSGGHTNHRDDSLFYNTSGDNRRGESRTSRPGFKSTHSVNSQVDPRVGSVRPSFY